MNEREQATWTRARLGRCGPPLDLLTACFDTHVHAPHAHDEYTIGVTTGGCEAIDHRGGLIRSGPGSLAGSVPATAAGTRRSATPVAQPSPRTNRSGIPFYLLVDRDAASVTLFGIPEDDTYREHRTHPFGKPVALPEPFAFDLDTTDFL
ncbi:AraC family ligand binding domain-containing protein [Streptomyces sp. NPDC004542]|uniref:AraC family ligand binding domain-containing protein n=1 Tax=Streptomyces sp. NPDC004542 TaxID=3154281 RepID=UPI0033A456AE